MDNECFHAAKIEPFMCVFFVFVITFNLSDIKMCKQVYVD